MKISVALTLFSMACVASAAKRILKTAQLNTIAATVPGAGVPSAPFPVLTGTPVAAGGSQTVTTAVSSQASPGGVTANSGTTTHQSTGIYPGFSDEAFNPYFPYGYPAYGRVYPGFHGRAHHRYFRWAYPGLSAGGYPGFFQGTRHGFFSGLYPGLLKSAHDGFFGGAYSRYLSGVYPGLFGGAYQSLYGPDFFRYGASERVRTHFAGFQEGATATVDPLSGLPTLIPVKVANHVVTIERLVPAPFPYPVPVPDPYPAQTPAPLPGVAKPGVVTTSTGSTTVSQGEVVAPVLGGSALVTAADHPGQTQTHVFT